MLLSFIFTQTINRNFFVVCHFSEICRNKSQRSVSCPSNLTFPHRLTIFFYLLNIIDGIKIRRALSKIESLWIGRYFIFVTLASSSQLMSKYLSKIFSFLFFEEGGTLQNRIFMNSYFIFITLASSLQLIFQYLLIEYFLFFFF